MCSKGGFTLVETLVAMLVGVAMVVAVGILGNHLVRQRSNADSNSAATSLALMQMERLRALPNPSTQPDLQAGTKGPFSIDATGAAAVGGAYRRSWVVVDNDPYVGSKRITVTVTHTNNPFVRCVLTTYYKIS